MAVLDTFDPGSIKPIRDVIYDHLREAVFNGELKPGDRLVESELGDRMNVSRTPIREALRKLEMEGIVEYLPRKGVVVKGFSREDIIEIYSIRQALEVMATLTATERITPEELAILRTCLDNAERHMACGDDEAVFKDHQEFTDTLIASSKMPRLVQLIGTYREYLQRFRRITLGKKQRQADVLVEHRAILDAVAEKNLPAVERLVKAHLQTALDAYLASLELESDVSSNQNGKDKGERNMSSKEGSLAPSR
jgi:DNA-binding GntR family transcriptional regulator